MFKSATVFRIGNGWTPDAVAIEAALQEAKFKPCGPTDLRSTGWSEPRGVENGPMLESVSGQWMLRLTTEKKDLPASVVQRALQEQLDKIETEEGRKPGKREKREIKEAVIFALLPQAFPKRGAVNIWIDKDAQLLYIDSTSTGVTDMAVTMLVRAIEGFQVSAIVTTMSPAGAMSAWLTARTINEKFDFGGECELQASDDSKANVKYARHRLDIEEIAEHIRLGKTPKTLALVWDDKSSFVLNLTMQLKKIKHLEEGMDEESTEGGSAGGKDDPFDANVALITGTLSSLVPDLIEILGGEMRPDSM